MNTTKSTPKRSATEIQQELRQMVSNWIDDLEAEVDQARKSERFLEFLQVLSHFPKRSINNTLLIQFQRPGATLVHGYHHWKKLGRHVKKGEKAIWIWQFKGYYTTDELDENGRRKIGGKRFGVATVFDISQTAPIEGHPQVDLDVIKAYRNSIDTMELDQSELLAHLYEVASRLDIHVEETDILGLTDGAASSWARRFPGMPPLAEWVIMLNEDRSTGFKAATLVHELAHVIAHFQARRVMDLTHTQREWEAEAISYVVCRYLQIETAAGDYLATYPFEPGHLKQVLPVIESTVRTIITLLEEVVGVQLEDEQMEAAA